jgi:hypothetical protein
VLAASMILRIAGVALCEGLYGERILIVSLAPAHVAHAASIKESINFFINYLN